MVVMNQVAQSSNLFRVEEAADMLRISHWTLRDWCKAGKVAHHRIGRKLMIQRGEIDKIISESQIK
jgi:excisionase family DNA binding protein